LCQGNRGTPVDVLGYPRSLHHPVHPIEKKTPCQP
jgi:hypothetical protein